MSQVIFYTGAFFLLVAFSVVCFEVFVGSLENGPFLFSVFVGCLFLSLGLFVLSYVLEGLGK